MERVEDLSLDDKLKEKINMLLPEIVNTMGSVGTKRVGKSLRKSCNNKENLKDRRKDDKRYSISRIL